MKKRNATTIAALAIPLAVGGCNPAGYPSCFRVECPYPPTYHASYAGYSPATKNGRPAVAAVDAFDDPFVDYTRRIDTVSPTAGNAQAANLALQTATPWPRNSGNTSIPGDGPAMVKAVQNYNSGNVPPLPALGSSSSSSGNSGIQINFGGAAAGAGGGQ